MASTADIPPKCTPNAQENTTVMHSKRRTIFGTTKNSLYVIKEHKYEIKKLNFSLDTSFFDAAKTEKDNFEKKTSLQTEKKSVHNLKEELPHYINNDSAKEVKETVPEEGNIYGPDRTLKRQSDTVSKEMYDCEETIGDHKDPVQHLRASCEEKTSMGQHKDLKFQYYGKDMKEVSNTVSEIQTISTKLDAVFKNRLCVIETKSPDDLLLQIQTYQEWVDTLLKRNKAAIKTLNALAEELSDSIEISAINADTRLRSYRDRDVLVKIIQEAFHSGVWHLDHLKLETVSLAEFLKSDLDISSDDSGSTKPHSSTNRKQQRRKKGPFTRSSRNE